MKDDFQELGDLWMAAGTVAYSKGKRSQGTESIHSRTRHCPEVLEKRAPLLTRGLTGSER